jgi:hypothetical protein
MGKEISHQSFKRWYQKKPVVAYCLKCKRNVRFLHTHWGDKDDNSPIYEPKRFK